jgi:hypothetical protein
MVAVLTVVGLLKLSTGRVTKRGTGTPEVMRSHFINGSLLGAWRTTHQTTFSLMPDPHTVPLWVTQRKIEHSTPRYLSPWC